MPKTSAAPPVPSLKEQLVRESCAMVRHLITNGTRVPASVVQAADQFESALERGQPVDMVTLASTHERLSRLVAPAKPGTLHLLDYDVAQTSRWSSLGPVKQVRDLVKVAGACVVTFILLSVLQLVEAHPDITLFGNQHPYLILRIILERIFWLSAAGIGASFAMLFQLNDQIVSRTYDPDEAASYWVKFFLGVVAGFILVALVPLDTTADTGAEALGPPTIALLGGFSASAVYRILTRMVEALESIFSGGTREQVLAAEKFAVTRAAEESTQGRMAVAGQLVQIQQRLAAGASAEEATAQLRDVVAGLVPSGSDAPTARNTPPAAAAPPEVEKVQAMVLVSAPEDVVPQPDASVSADESGSPAAQRDESAAAVG
ncbi:hypothetical protein [Longimicrobium sp.]|uniref:hypothetical protein n=1 Tax=Longimicrobium sp. TaxID=2029185 RepID=UPI003B3A45F3